MKRLLLTSLFILLSFVMAFARIGDVSFAYGVDASTYFDNRENDGGGNLFTSSMTVFGARIAPEIGLSVRDSHRLMGGVNLLRDFGSSKTLDADIFFYYNLEKRLSERTHFGLSAGIFPRTKSRGYYSEAFFSDSLKFYDPNFEGILFRFDHPHSYYELGVDWIGQKGPGCRERFMIFSAGEYHPTDFLKLAYSAYMYHFASSDEVSGVVDNILLNPYVEFDAGRMASLQRLSLSIGWLQAVQRDRVMSGEYLFPGGLEAVFDIRKWNVGVNNRFFYGSDMMPLYNNCDAGGYKYGTQLYYGLPYYRVRAECFDGFKAYDRAEVYWEPRIAEGLYFKIAAVFHFNGAFSGSQQIISIRYVIH